MVGIGFFAPLPLALMMPFMAGQSMLMGDAFGKAYQYGKRKISAMSNEEFNKLTAAQLGKEIVSDYSDMIPSLQVAIKQSSEFQSLIIQELAKIVRSIPKDIISGFSGEGPSPVQTIHQEATSENIDYGKIAIATLKIMLGPIGAGFVFPQEAHATSGNGSTTIPPPAQEHDMSAGHHQDIQGGDPVVQKYGNLTYSDLTKIKNGSTWQYLTDAEKLYINNQIKLLAPSGASESDRDAKKEELASQPTTITVRVQASHPVVTGQNKTDAPRVGQVRKFFTTLIKKSNRASRVVNQYSRGGATSGGTDGQGYSLWAFKVYGMSNVWSNNEKLYFIIPKGY